MRSRVPFIALLVAVSSFVVPFIAHAGGIPFFGPIIPQTANQATCPASWGMVLMVINNLISFALTMTIVFVAPLMIAYSGFLYVVNPVDPAGMSKAKSILQNTIVGTVIALASWMIVDAVMAVLYNPSSPGETWYSLIGSGGMDLCLPQAGITGAPAPARPAVSVVPTPPRITVPPTIPRVPSVPGVPSAVPFTPSLSQTAISSAASKANAYRQQVCAAAVQQGVGNQCNQLLGMLGVESNGNTTATSPKGAIGLMQLMPTTAAQMGVSACSGSSNTNPSPSCVSALRDPATNINAGVKLYAQGYKKFGDVANATAAYNAGGGSALNSDGKKVAFSPSTDCPGLVAWQCQVNPEGLAETQRYVANVNAVAEKLSSQGY